MGSFIKGPDRRCLGAYSQAWQLGLIVSLFFLWGAANNLNDILIKQFQKAFTLRDMQASLVQSAFYAGYFVGALPAARMACSYGYKLTIMCGLGLFTLGSVLFYPVSRGGGWYPGFLVCLYLIAFGLAFLESSANPWILQLADDQQQGAGTRALNFAQAFNPLGSIAGILVGRFFILDGAEPKPAQGLSQPEVQEYRRHEAAMVGMPYVALAIVVATVGLVFQVTPFPRGSPEEDAPERQLTVARLASSAVRMWRTGAFLHGLLAQFAYVGAQVCVWSFVIRFVQAELPGTEEQRAADAVLLSLVVFVCGRFFAAVLLRYTTAPALLCAYAAIASALCVVGALVGGKVGVGAVVAVSFFMSMMFPTIFGLALEPLGRNDSEVGAALLVMCVIGGAVMTPIMGLVSDATSIAIAYLVPGGCFVVILAYGLQHKLGRFSNEGENKGLLD